MASISPSGRFGSISKREYVVRHRRRVDLRRDRARDRRDTDVPADMLSQHVLGQPERTDRVGHVRRPTTSGVIADDQQRRARPRGLTISTGAGFIGWVVKWAAR